MKKIILLIIELSIILLCIPATYGHTVEQYNYERNTLYDYKTKNCYYNYEYNETYYPIMVPCDYNVIKYYEGIVMSGGAKPDSYEMKLIYLNILLMSKGLPPLYN